jgi:acetylglutamate kinase
METPVGPYLTKFAVERQAQGEGLGSEIWSLVTRDYPAFFWRSRPENPITAWYVKQCDGLLRLPRWHVFWRGLPVETIDPAVRHALAAESDFV